MKRWFFARSAYGGCCYYRQQLPIKHLYPGLRERGVTVKLGSRLPDSLSADVVFFSRNIGAQHLSYVLTLKRMGKLIVWDMDDDLSIPHRWTQWKEGNRTFVLSEISALQWCLDFADIITVSTEGLKKAIGRPEKTLVCQNAIDLDDWREVDFRNLDSKTWRILYAGTPTHQADLELVRSLYAETASSWDWFFFGCKPYWMGSRGTYMPLTSIRDYPRICRELRPTHCLAPLVPDPFNESKSPIKVWEMATTGAVVVASDTGPYRWHPSAVVPEGEPFGHRHLLTAGTQYRMEESRMLSGVNSWHSFLCGPVQWHCLFHNICDRLGYPELDSPIEDVISVSPTS